MFEAAVVAAASKLWISSRTYFLVLPLVLLLLLPAWGQTRVAFAGGITRSWFRQR